MGNLLVSFEQIDRIGQLADTCDNLLAAAELPLLAELHVEGLRGGVEKIRAELVALYRELGGTDDAEISG